MPETILNIIQQAQNVSGTMVGFKAGVVEGDVIEIKFYGLQSDGPNVSRSSIWQRTLSQFPPQPYKLLQPYDSTDENVFNGRVAESEAVLRSLRWQHVVIYGRAGVGKTSLLAAGVIPLLIREGALILQIQNYSQPVTAIRRALEANVENIRIDWAEEDTENPSSITLPDLIYKVIQATRGTLFLVFDQFELLFEPTVSDAQRTRFIEGLITLLNVDEFLKDLAKELNVTTSSLLRVIVVVRDEASGRVAELQQAVPNLLDCHLTLQSLTLDAAFTALKESLGEFADDEFLRNYLIADLDALTPDEPGRIYPPHLQIVCHWLYQEAIKARPHVIDSKLMEKSNGAEGILARYVLDILERELKDIRELALQVLAQMASPGVKYWVPADEFQLRDVPASELPAKRDGTLERLVSEKLIVRRTVDEKRQYRLLSAAIAAQARRLSGSEVASRYQAQDEMEGLWSAWLARDVLASRDQLRYLTPFGPHLTPTVLQALFLLRSTVERDEPAAVWLEQLRIGPGQTLISQLEKGTVPKDAQAHSLTILRKAERLLALSDNAAVGPGVDEPIGPLARNSVVNEAAGARQATALALTVLGHKDARYRINASLQESARGWQRRARRAELFGIMADASGEMAQLNARLPRLDRLLIWKWRAWRRITRDLGRSLKQTVYGAFGAALGMGILRAFLTFLSDYPPGRSPGVLFFASFFYAFIYCGALLFGLALAESLLPVASRENDRLPAPAWAEQTRPTLLTLLLGAAFFLFASAFKDIVNVFALDAVSLQSLLVNFVIGLCLSLALYRHARPAPNSKSWLQLLIGPLALLLMQLFFNRFRNQEPSASFIWNFETYREMFQLYSWIPQQLQLLSLLDAFLVGLVLCAGAALGLTRARKATGLRPGLGAG